MNGRNGKWTAALRAVFMFALCVLALHALGASLHEVGTGLCLAMAGGGIVAEVDPGEWRGGLATIRSNVGTMAQKIDEQERQLQTLRASNEELTRQLNTLRKSGLSATRAAVDPARGKFVSDACARHLAAIVILSADKLNKLTHLSANDLESVRKSCREILGVEARAALTTTDIPLPTTFGNEVVELVWMYGQARKYCTVFPLGTGTAKLPKLKTSPAFGFIDVSANVPEKSPQIEFATFTAEKAGGLVRLPTEISEDSIVGLGQFIANYVAREMAKFEDVVTFTADGTATYKSFKGIGKAAVDLGNKVQLAATKTKPTDITLANLRTLRTKVDTAALANSAYYLNMTHEALLSSFNTGGDKPYIPNGANGATLDGFPIRWVDVLPVYEDVARVSQIQVLFGDARFEYLGVRDEIRIETSAEVYFATDELAIRALERFVPQLMADKAVAALQLAAA